MIALPRFMAWATGLICQSEGYFFCQRFPSSIYEAGFESCLVAITALQGAMHDC